MDDDDGEQSCIRHALSDTNFQRSQDFFLAVSSITKANPAVVTLASGAVAANKIVAGNQVWFDDIAGMTGLNHNFYTVANISGDTFELSGTDSTGFGAFTSGHMRNRTGPALLLAGCCQVSMAPNYLLTYGYDAIVVDSKNATAPSGWLLDFQHEANPRESIIWGLPASGTVVAREIHIRSLGKNQVLGAAFFTSATTGTGKLELQSSSIRLSQNTSGKPIFGNPGNFILRYVDVHTQYDNSCSASQVAAMSAIYNLRVFAADNTVAKIYGTGNQFLSSAAVEVGAYSATGASYGKKLDYQIFYSSRTETVQTDHAQFANPNGVVGHIQTSASATIFATASDERKKDFIGEYDPDKAIEIIKADPVREFTWKVDGLWAVGWGAQTSYAVSPDLAAHNEETDSWGIDQGKRTPYLWAALAGLIARVEALEAKPPQKT